MLMQIGIFVVCLAVSLFFSAKATREVFTTVREQNAKKVVTKAPSEKEKRKAQRDQREIQNFMTYNGKTQEENYGD